MWCTMSNHGMTRKQFLHLAAGAAALPTISRVARAQAYPSRPVRIVVGFPAGGPSDITARLIGQWLSERLGQSFVIENRPGAGGNIGTEAVVKAPPDGYTLLQVDASRAINATLYTNLDFNFIRDITPVIDIMRVPGVIVVHPSVPATTVPEFIAYAKANPGKLSMASAGNGTPQHVYGELFKMMAGVNLFHVPYRGGAPASTDLLGGQGNTAHVFPRSADDMRTFAMPASRQRSGVIAAGQEIAQQVSTALKAHVHPLAIATNGSEPWNRTLPDQ
jgi:tripartite-type tricarboxylate transporter receptor subunit TctC